MYIYMYIYVYIHIGFAPSWICRIWYYAGCIDPFWDKSSFVASIEGAKPVLIQNRFSINTGFVA